MTMKLARVLAIPGVIALLASASPSAIAVTGGTPASAAAWTATTAPLPANADHTSAQLDSLACPTASTCTAVGSYSAGSAGTQGLLLTRSAGHWTAAQAPLPAGAAADQKASLQSVTCFSASACAAVGTYTDSSGNPQGLLLTGSGSSWTAAEAPLPANGVDPGQLTAVSCASATSCLAVGAYYVARGDIQGELITGSGTQWTAAQAPLPANAAADPYAVPTAVACTRSTGGCVVVGNYSVSAESGESFLITGSGSSWAVTEAPLPANVGTDPDPNLRAVRCQSPSSCTVVGSYITTAYTGGLLLTGSGSSWTATEAPVPPNASKGSSWLWAESCPGPATCIATGNYSTADPADLMLVTASGSSLTAAQAPVPGNALSGATPEALACASASACVITGQYEKTPAKPIRDRGFLVYGSGSSLTAIQAPAPHGGEAIDVPAVLCPKKAPACIAVGYYKNDGDRQGLLLKGPA